MSTKSIPREHENINLIVLLKENDKTSKMENKSIILKVFCLALALSKESLLFSRYKLLAIVLSYCSIQIMSNAFKFHSKTTKTEYKDN